MRVRVCPHGTLQIWDFGHFFTSVCVGKFWTLHSCISTKTLFYPISCDGHINWVLKSKKLHEPREESATSARWPASQKNQFLGNSLNPNIIHDPPRGQRNSTWNFWHGHTLETLNTHREHGFLQCWSWVANKCVQKTEFQRMISPPPDQIIQNPAISRQSIA